MQDDILHSLKALPDHELVDRVKSLATREREATAQLIAHLAELDTRDVYLRAGHGSLFAYCRDVLALTEQESFNRIAAARAARRFPVILALLETGELNLTAVRLLAPHLTAENHREVLESARGKNKLQVEEIAARLWPRPDVASSVRKLPAPRSAVGTTNGAPPSTPGSASVVPSAPGAGPLGRSPVIVPHLGRPVAEVSALSPDRYRVQITIGGATLDKLRLAKDLLRHALPSGDEAAILDRALSALLADLARRKFGATDNPRPASATAAGSRHVPAEVKRAVWVRDLGRCAFVGTDDRRCNERAFLEFHHVRPYAAGGEATVANVQLRCRRHNDYEARTYFGGANGHGLVREEPALYRAGRSERLSLVLERVAHGASATRGNQGQHGVGIEPTRLACGRLPP
jgi:hypothetical protein